MTYLEKIRGAQTLKDVAHILGVQPKTVSYLLYILPEAEKYHSFEIPKRNGGRRLINAPEPRLKMLQGRLAYVLDRCVADAEKDTPPRRPLAHGFVRSRSIFTNASVHKNRRYVLNLDLEDFFPSFNFGRVRGFFIKDKRFELNEKVATVIAQIACHNNELPQGSPCSPIISNLLGHMLDVRLARFARKNKCTYSRYADDITFSTNLKDFPIALAKQNLKKPQHWGLGSPLIREIHDAGFKINNDKTRMQLRGSRQETTGLIVNKKVNIKSEYYRKARVICHRLFSTGSYYISDPENSLESLNKVEGILNYIYYIKISASKEKDKKDKREVQSAIQKLYKKFLFYKHFVVLEKPLIVTEGKTDPMYLRVVIKNLTEYHPRLGKVVDGKFSSAVRFLRYSDTIKKILELGGGASNIVRFFNDYKKTINSFKFKRLDYPVIILIDNDDGAKSIFNSVESNFRLKISHKTTEQFYRLHNNLYLVKTPEYIVEDLKTPKSCIEHLFGSELLEKQIDGKMFDPFKKYNKDSDTYSKIVFAEKVVIPNADKTDFSKFGRLLDRIVAVLDDYEQRKSSSSNS